MWISNEKEYEQLNRKLCFYATNDDGYLEVVYLPETESTNSWAKEHELWSYDSACVFTRHQTAGRGTHNRQWVQRAGLDAAVTMLMSTRELAPDPRTTLVAGAAVAKAIEELYDLPVGLKWPNDILLPIDGTGRQRWLKTGGILTETAGGNLVIGVGINCNSKAKQFPPELRDTVTTIKDATGNHQSVCQLVERLFHSLIKVRDAVWNKDLDGLLAEWKTRNRTSGTRYLLTRDGVSRQVTAVGVEFPDGWLNVVDDNGNEYVVISHSELSVPGEEV